MESTLCYIEQDGQILLLHRTKKHEDPNAGKWIGVGGKLEAGETPEVCVVREVREETGLTLVKYELCGEIFFQSDVWQPEKMYLYYADEVTGMLTECNEGELAWIPRERVMDMPTWEGDRIFLERLLAENTYFRLVLRYEGERLIGHEFLEEQR